MKTVVGANRKIVDTAESGAAQCGETGTGDGADNDVDGTADDGCPSVIYDYDKADRLVEVIDALGNRTSYGYDLAGNRTSITGARAAIRPAGLNGPETPLQCGPAGFGNGFNEDAAVDDTVADDGCPSALYAYDALNRLQSTTDALNHVTSYQYDPASNLKQRTDARSIVTNYRYDLLNRLDCLWTGAATPACPMPGSQTFKFDEVSNRTEMIDPTGTTNYGYDALNRLTCVGPTIIGGSCPSGNVGYQYDSPGGGGGLPAQYPGQRTKITYPDLKTVSYTYEKDGRMQIVTDWLSKQTLYTYDDAGRLIRTQLPNSVCTDYAYDAADRLTSMVNRRMALPQTCSPSDATISSFTYPIIDAAGNRKQMVDLSGTHSYNYDALHRVKDVTYPGPQTDTYMYDPNGNRQTKNGANYSYDAAERMVTDKDGVTYGYDNNGNQTGRGSDVFFYDHENRLTKINIGGVERDPCYDLTGDGAVTGADLSPVAARIGTGSSDPNYDDFYDIAPPPNGDDSITGADLSLVAGQIGLDCPTSRFTYNGDGLRATRVSSRALDMRYLWDVAAGLPVILRERDLHNTLDGHGTDNTYVYGLDLISVTERTGAQTYFVYDGLGSTANVTDGSSNTTATYSYDVFGLIRSESGAGAGANEWGSPGSSAIHRPTATSITCARGTTIRLWEGFLRRIRCLVVWLILGHRIHMCTSAITRLTSSIQLAWCPKAIRFPILNPA